MICFLFQYFVWLHCILFPGFTNIPVPLSCPFVISFSVTLQEAEQQQPVRGVPSVTGAYNWSGLSVSPVFACLLVHAMSLSSSV